MNSTLASGQHRLMDRVASAPVHLGHLGVHEHEVGLELLGKGGGLEPAAGDAHHIHVRLRREDAAQAVPGPADYRRR